MTDKIVCRDGFDLYPDTGAGLGMASRWQFINFYSNQTFDAGRFGGRAYFTQWSGSVQYSAADRLLDSPATDFTVGFAYKVGALDAVPFMWLLDGANFQFCLRADSDGRIYACRSTAWGAQVDLGSSAPGKLIPNTWAFIEVSGTLANAAGVRIWIDGELVLTLAGVDTDNAGSFSADRIRLGYYFSGSARWFDDLYVTNYATPLGPCRVFTSPVISDGAHQDFTPSSAGTHFSLLDEQPLTSADYVSGSAVGQYDDYGIAPITSTPFFIAEVNLLAVVSKTDAGVRAVSLGVNSGGTIVDSADVYLSNTPEIVNVPLAKNPNGNVAWTQASVNALILRPKITI